MQTAAADRTLDIVLCHRPLPAQPDAPHGATRALTAAGHRVEEVADGPLDLRPDQVLWIQDNPNWFPTVLRQLRATPRRSRPLTVLWFSEPLPPPSDARLPKPRLHLKEIAKIALRDARMTDPYSNAARLRAVMRHGLVDVLAASTPARCAWLGEHGIAAHFVPLGYVPEDHGRDLGLERDIDVLFLGALVPRRRRLVAELRRQGIDVRVEGSWSDPSTWGEARTRLLNRTRIYLNLSRFPGELPGLRLILGMASKALVVSEPIHAPGPYVPGTHFVECGADDRPATIVHYLAHRSQREKIAAAGHELVTGTVTMKRSVDRLLRHVEAAARRKDVTLEARP